MFLNLCIFVGGDGDIHRLVLIEARVGGGQRLG